jgi:hypothetical protein
VDGPRFDAMSRSVAADASRRSVFRTLAAGSAGGVGGLLGPRELRAQGQGQGGRRSPRREEDVP